MSSLIAGQIGLADRAHVLAAFAAFARRPPSQWLRPGHPGRSGKLPNSWNAVRRLPVAQVIETTAASAPQHCVDGWSYVARALSSIAQGDPHAARHMAYYAQLRAGLSILANLGVGVFDGINFSITAAGRLERLDPVTTRKSQVRGPGTHTVVWDALNEWARDPNVSGLFLDLLKVRNTTLRTCLTSVWPGFPAAAATALIEAWGIDLRRGVNEKNHRNTSSYLPQALNPIAQPTIDDLRLIESVWELFGLTDALSSFDNLDKHLLRRLLQQQHDVVSPANLKGRYNRGSIYSRYGHLPAEIQSLAGRDFLTGNVPTPALLSRAQATTNPANALEMIARAFMLLRVATGFTYTSFGDVGVDCSSDALRPWLNELAAARGFWPVAAPYDETFQLWEEVEEALQDFRTSTAAPPVDLHAWLAASPQGVPHVHQAERIVVWALSA